MTKQISNGVNKTIISIGVTILVLGTLFWAGRPNSESSTPPPIGSNGILTVEETNNYDFGSISMAKGTVMHQFRIRNTSSEVVVVNKMYTSCMCTTAELILGDERFGPYGMPGHGSIPRIDHGVLPNEEAIIEVVFDPAAHGPAGVGRIERAVTIENNAGEPIELLFSAMVTP